MVKVKVKTSVLVDLPTSAAITDINHLELIYWAELHLPSRQSHFHHPDILHLVHMRLVLRHLLGLPTGQGKV
jgi:hypothetical protein